MTRKRLYEVAGFYTDNRPRKRPITKSRRRVRESNSPKMKVVSPESVEETKPIIRKTSYTKNNPSKILRDWWIPEARQLYDHLRKYSSRHTPIGIMALFKEVKKGGQIRIMIRYMNIWIGRLTLAYPMLRIRS